MFVPAVATNKFVRDTIVTWDPLPSPEYYGIELERLTDKQVSKNITFPQTMYAGGNKETEI